MERILFKQTYIFPLLFLFTASVLLADASIDVIIPKPQKMIQKKGIFLLHKKIKYCSNTALSKNALVYLQGHLKHSSGYTLSKVANSKNCKLHFQYSTKKLERPEAYRLDISTDHINISARDKAGFFYALVSFMQLMESDIWKTKPLKIKKKSWTIACCSIEDYPRFEWRGMMLDSSRNFFSKAYVKKFIDRMAQVKLNRFHWHLTDDEGWRVEIKKYPKLAQIGARRGPGTKLPFSTYPAMRGPKNRVQSGYYSQSDIKEVVAYAKARSIEILPEIDMPGHAKAAIISYPQLLEDPQDKSNYRSVQKVQNNTVNPALESTYVFLDNVIAELSKLFPFGYIHVGGDEIPSGAWKKSPAVKTLMQKKRLTNRKEVQKYFFTRLDNILVKHTRKMIAWQEIAKKKTKLRSQNIFMTWKSTKDAKHLLKQKHHVIMTPVQYLYFDQQYKRNKKEPGHTWSTPVSTKKVYSFKPINSNYVTGIQACLWSETLLNEQIADYLAWPRMFALAEAAWTAQHKRVWKTFEKRLSKHGLERLKKQGVAYRKD